MMTKQNARAILQCKKTIDKAIEVCLAKLTGDEKIQAESYWAAHVKSCMNGQAYGSAPILRAAEFFEERKNG